MNPSNAPIHQSECSTAATRGAQLTLKGTVTILSVAITYWHGSYSSQCVREKELLRCRLKCTILDYGRSITDSSLQRRLPLASQAVFAIFLVFRIMARLRPPAGSSAYDREKGSPLGRCRHPRPARGRVARQHNGGETSDRAWRRS